MNPIGYCMRVTALDGYAAKLPMLTACCDYESILAVKHHGSTKENPHYHLVIKTDVQQQAFRVRMRKVFDKGKGNQHMSIVPWDGEFKAVSYLFHEETETQPAEVMLQHNISDETVAKAKEMNREVQALVQSAKDKAAWHLEGIVYEEVKADPVISASPQVYECKIGQRLILAALRHGKYVPQPWHVRAMVQRIQFKLLNGDVDDEAEFAERLARQIFYRE